MASPSSFVLLVVHCSFGQACFWRCTLTCLPPTRPPSHWPALLCYRRFDDKPYVAVTGSNATWVDSGTITGGWVGGWVGAAPCSRLAPVASNELHGWPAHHHFLPACHAASQAQLDRHTAVSHHYPRSAMPLPCCTTTVPLPHRPALPHLDLPVAARALLPHLYQQSDRAGVPPERPCHHELPRVSERVSGWVRVDGLMAGQSHPMQA